MLLQFSQGGLVPDEGQGFLGGGHRARPVPLLQRIGGGGGRRGGPEADVGQGFLAGQLRFQIQVPAVEVVAAAGRQEQQGRKAGCPGSHDPRSAPGVFPTAFPRPDRPRQDRPAFQPALEIVGQLAGAGVSLAGVLAQAFEADRLQVARHFRLQPRRRHRLLSADQLERFPCRGPLERRAARQQFVEDRRQGVDVRRRADGVAAALGLFGGHVRRRADDGPAQRSQAVVVEPFGQAEVADLGLESLQGQFGVGVRWGGVWLAAQQHVGRLEVAVEDASLVSGVDRPGQRGDESRRLPCRLGCPSDPPVEAAAFDQFQRKERLAAFLADLMNLHDIGVAEACDNRRLGAEALDLLGLPRGPLRGSS